MGKGQGGHHYWKKVQKGEINVCKNLHKWAAVFLELFFKDKTKVELLGNAVHQFVYKQWKKAHKEKNTLLTCYAALGTGGIQYQRNYEIRILPRHFREKCLTQCQTTGLRWRSWVCQHGIYLKHTSSSTKQWLKRRQGVKSNIHLQYQIHSKTPACIVHCFYKMQWWQGPCNSNLKYAKEPHAPQKFKFYLWF